MKCMFLRKKKNGGGGEMNGLVAENHFDEFFVVDVA